MKEDMKPGYKHTALGWIPEEWNIVGFTDMVTIGNGQVDPKAGNNHGMILIAPNHIESGTGQIIYTETARQQNAISGKYQVNQGEIIYSKIRPYLKKAAIAPFDCLCSADMYALKPRKNVHPIYALALLLGDRFTSYAVNQSGRTGIPKVNRDELQGFAFSLPPLSEQNKIATVLSTWDAAVAAESARISALQSRHRALMQRLLLGKVRLKGFAGEWRKLSYASLLQVVKRPVTWNDNDLYKLISVRRRSGGIFLREALYGHQIKVKDLRTAKKGDFLFSKMQILHGASALVTAEFDNAKISGSYIATTARNPKLLDIDYFSWYSKLPYFYHQTYISSYGVHIEKMTFDFEAFLSLEMHLPPIVEQRAIANILATADREIDAHKAHLVALQWQKKGLMQVLLTGKKRVTIN